MLDAFKAEVEELSEIRFFFGNKYLNSPAGDHRKTNLDLRKMIEFIGAHERGYGSKFGKGMRKIKSQIKDCSSNEIKFVVKSAKNYLLRNYVEEDRYVFRFSKNNFVEIYSTILSLYNAYSNSAGKLCSKILLVESYDMLSHLIVFGKNECIRSKAQEIYNSILEIDKNYCE